MAVILAIGVIIVILLARLFFARGGKTPDANVQALGLLQNQISAGTAETARKFDGLQRSLQEDIRRLNEIVERRLTDTGRSMGERLDNSSRVISDVRQQLGRMDEASRRIFEVGREISELQQTLQSPKLRGSMGEYLLSELLAQVLPEKSYENQHRFQNGETADAVIKLSSGIIPIDAKFPLENFKRILSAGDDGETSAAGRAFARDVKKHIDAIAQKYIRTDEGTFDFAMMYIPAESVFYEIIARNEWNPGEPLLQYALAKRVIPVSPNSFYAYLQTILLGLRGMRVEENAREIINGILRLQKELEVFAGDFELVGTHLNNSLKKYADAARRFDRLGLKMEQLTGLSQTAEDNVIPSLPPQSGAAK
ncbi:MAG: DNA recombination protein RmuC [Kiritimatiellae bacterium]|nr:DNA recombination protein RmuC [Kiritimatiellia bacterium]